MTLYFPEVNSAVPIYSPQVLSLPVLSSLNLFWVINTYISKWQRLWKLPGLQRVLYWTSYFIRKEAHTFLQILCFIVFFFIQDLLRHPLVFTILVSWLQKFNFKCKKCFFSYHVCPKLKIIKSNCFFQSGVWGPQARILQARLRSSLHLYNADEILLPLQPISTALARVSELRTKLSGSLCVHRKDVNCTSTVNYEGADKRDAMAKKVIPVKKGNTSLA